MLPSSTYHVDHKKETLLNPYLDDLYRDMHINFDRTNDTNMQYKGIDVKMYNRYGRTFLVDEKAQLDHLNRSLGTFAFEIGYFKEGSHRKGWLFSEEKITTHYALYTDIFLIDEKEDLTETSDIASLNFFWLNRQVLITELEALGLNKAYCEKMEQVSRDNGKIDKIASGLDIDPKVHYFFLSDKKAEKPFNLVIKMKWLRSIGGVQLFPPTIKPK